MTAPILLDIMELMEHGAASRPVPPPGCPEETKQANSNERQMLHSDPFGPKATYVPPQILDVANGSVADQIGIILEYIKQVPPQTLTALPEYQVEVLLQNLPVIKSGLEKISQGIHPSSPLLTDEEFRLATGPTSTFHDLAEALGEIARTQPMSVADIQFIYRNIQQPLAELADLPLGHPVVSPLIGMWLERILVQREADAPGAGPDLSFG